MQPIDQPVTPALTGSVFERSLKQRLTQLRECELTIVEPGGRSVYGDPAGREVQRCTITVHDVAMYQRVALGGSVGVAEAYMEGLWSADDLVALIRIFVRNRDLLDAMEGGMARLGGWFLRAWHALQRNTKFGSKKNIAAHYDLGNALFRLFLDDTLMYSAAVYTRPEETLEQASKRKLDRICQKLDLRPGQHLLEIGTGWGGLALHAATHFGCKVTTTTISEEQHALASERIAAAGLSERISVLLSDYRDLTGQFDKLVSVEMIEAIGHQYLQAYFGKLGELLKDDGLALIQAITIEDSRYERALKDIDFIKRYIFPGSFIPSVSAMLGALAKTSNMKLVHLEDIGPSYALTLREWRRRFLGKQDEVRALGYPNEFVRMWDYYLAYCEGGFLERSIGDVQMLMAKPRNRRVQFMPDLDPKI